MHVVRFLRMCMLISGVLCHVLAEEAKELAATAPALAKGMDIGNASTSYIQKVCTGVLQNFVQGLEFGQEITDHIVAWKRKEGACFKQEGYLGRYDEDLEACRSCDEEGECIGECAADCTVSLEIRKLSRNVLANSDGVADTKLDIAYLKEKVGFFERDKSFQQDLSIAAISASITSLLAVVIVLTLYHACTVARMQRRLDELRAVRNTHDVAGAGHQPIVQADGDDQQPLIQTKG